MFNLISGNWEAVLWTICTTESISILSLYQYWHTCIKICQLHFSGKKKKKKKKEASCPWPITLVGSSTPGLCTTKSPRVFQWLTWHLAGLFGDRDQTIYRHSGGYWLWPPAEREQTIATVYINSYNGLCSSESTKPPRARGREPIELIIFKCAMCYCWATSHKDNPVLKCNLEKMRCLM